MNSDDTPPIPEASDPDDPGKRLKQRFKFRRVREITGTFVLIIIGLLIAAVVWTGRSQRWFKSNVSLRIILPESGAAGIREGSEVFFLGTRVGAVSDIIVDKTGRMVARVSIRRDFFLFMRSDSSAVVKKTFGLGGDSFFEIDRGKGLPLSEKNASIICKEQSQSALESAIEDIRSQTVIVLKKTSAGLDTWTRLGADLRETRGRLDQLTLKLERITSGVEEGKGTVGKLLADPALADEAANLLSRANRTMIGFQEVLTNLNEAVKNVEAGATRVPEIAGAAANGMEKIPALLDQTQTSMRELERLIEAMQRHWLIRKYVNRTNPPPSRPATADPKRPLVPRPHSPKNATQ
jgi:phospholipid/cholesterol/gamma-HCH transport system substrate-binding protein